MSSAHLSGDNSPVYSSPARSSCQTSHRISPSPWISLSSVHANWFINSGSKDVRYQARYFFTVIKSLQIQGWKIILNSSYTRKKLSETAEMASKKVSQLVKFLSL